MEQLAALRTAFARLGFAKLATMGVVALAVLMALAWVAARPSEPKGLLYAGLDPAEGGRIAQRLDELKVPFEARGDGTIILVPVSQVARMRMELAASGLPHQAGAGYELLDAQSPMNMTSFMQHVQRLRALEGELARTIITMAGVKSARVHIVLPERESFARDAPAPTASVAVTMVGAARLSASQAAAVRLLVAGAVPRLRQEDVSVIDPSGIVLAADGANALATGRLAEVKAAQEQGLQRAVLNLLEPIIGIGRVRAVAAVDLDASRETAREEKFDPLSQVERSKQSQTDQETSDETRPRDPVTVGQNVPNQQTPPPAAANRTATSANHQGQTTNYEISSVLSERVREPGGVRRLTVAVVLDGDAAARPPAEMERLTALVRAAVGFDEKRGDSVTVETMAFAPLGDRPGTEAGGAVLDTSSFSWGAAIAVLLLVLLAGGGGGAVVVRRRSRLELARREAQLALQRPDAPAEEMVMLANMDAAIRASTVTALAALVDERPVEVLAVVRAWIADGASA